MRKRNVAILLFNDVEVLDFAGPFEVFSVTAELNNYECFDVYTVAEKPGAITAVNGLSVNPKYSFADCPRPDIVIIPGGIGSRTRDEQSSCRRMGESLLPARRTGSFRLFWCPHLSEKWGARWTRGDDTPRGDYALARVGARHNHSRGCTIHRYGQSPDLGWHIGGDRSVFSHCAKTVGGRDSSKNCSVHGV
jgi:hypothetical protein